MAARSEKLTATELIAQPITLPCGLTLPNRLVKCPMQETLATAPLFDPPIDKFENLYTQWANAKYGLIITGQVQVDIRFLSIKGDVVCHDKALEEPYISKWKRWAKIAQQGGTPCIVQLAHPGRMSPAGAGNRPADMQALCPSSVPVKLGEGWLNKVVGTCPSEFHGTLSMRPGCRKKHGDVRLQYKAWLTQWQALDKMLGTPREMTLQDIDEVVAMWVRGASVAKEAGFVGCQLHGAHGFLLSQFLSPYTNRRTDDYGGTPEKRLTLLKRLVTEIRMVCPRPYCLSVKLNSADYMDNGGLSQDEGYLQVKWLAECGMIDFIEISGDSFGARTLSEAPKMSESTRIREAYFTDFAERVQDLKSDVPIQLSGGFRSRIGMADAIDSGVCALIGLGRTAVLNPYIPVEILLNRDVPDDAAIAPSHIVKGQWFANLIPVKVVGAGLAIQFFYHNMRRLGNGLKSDPDLSIPWVVFEGLKETVLSGLFQSVQKILQSLPLPAKGKMD